MIVEVAEIKTEFKQVEVEIKPCLYLLIVRYTRKDGSQFIQKHFSESLNVYFGPHENAEPEVIRWFIYTLNAEKQGWEFNPDYTGEYR